MRLLCGCVSRCCAAASAAAVRLRQPLQQLRQQQSHKRSRPCSLQQCVTQHVLFLQAVRGARTCGACAMPVGGSQQPAAGCPSAFGLSVRACALALPLASFAFVTHAPLRNDACGKCGCRTFAQLPSAVRVHACVRMRVPVTCLCLQEHSPAVCFSCHQCMHACMLSPQLAGTGRLMAGAGASGIACARASRAFCCTRV